MPSDLNLKKSWHPSLLKNQRKIHELEQSALQEHRAITERGAEMTRERERLELLALQYGGAVPEHVKKKLTLGWMYDDKSDEPSVLPGAGESDEFLLGKRRVDTLVEKGKEKSQLERVMETGELPPAKLLHEDPMMKIMRSRQQHAAKMRSREGRALETFQ
ncbi:hypothetical protein BABINDRAFT_13197 [Babjeviella inositovora NRRL Y-12698]|uniref:Pre-mRNA-splicing factor CWC25 n=1 Tax=Babjeviella inositovora NRRL Y-12698 TaxID=984486 RepID=A0A1E3QRL6_9ASCO|nr:uncharacterized protein BABINDRAFT_13197 [Babjeviella inositovora NRRL Y-12698]ODQ80339.1 hypothetical protein BABINDRAFT_13197 [Babjeviella inositovora NRRL Y-12698]